MAAENLPAGVGRVPKWWMEITPHYTLDLEEENYRRDAEEQMALYYAQMAAAADAGVLDADGNPILGPDGKPIGGWSNGWAGRAPNGGEGGLGINGPLGRNFQPGQVTPEVLSLLGIEKTDPDYRSYLTGAKMPPGYWEKLADLGYTGQGFSASNLHQTDYGRYGRQAEKPAFQPSWAKLKLKSTNHGSSIRKGDYEASPDRSQRRLQVEMADIPDSILSAPRLEMSGPPPAPPTPATTPAVHKSVRAAPEQQEDGDGEAPKTRLVRKVRKIKKKKRPQEESAAPAPTPAPAPVPTPTSLVRAPPPQSEPIKPVAYSKYSHKDYYYNAPAHTANMGAPRPEQAPVRYEPKPVLVSKPVPAPAPSSPQKPVVAPAPIVRAPVAPPSPEKEHSEYEEEIIEEEISEEEEIIEESVSEDYDDQPQGSMSASPDINDLQAILRAKQAELARLQAQLR